MDVLNELLKLIGSYPTWAKAAVLSGLAVAIAVLIFAKPISPKPIPPAQADSQLYLRISRVALYPDDPTAEVQVVASVNGTEYIFPSVANVKWMRVGPDMNQKIIPLPTADVYQITFRMNYRLGRSAGNEEPHKIIRVARQGLPAPTILPHNSEYKLYPISSATASSAVAAVVTYQVGPDGQ